MIVPLRPLRGVEYFFFIEKFGLCLEYENHAIVIRGLVKRLLIKIILS